MREGVRDGSFWWSDEHNHAKELGSSLASYCSRSICEIGNFLGYASRRGRVLIDRTPYLTGD